MRIPDRDTAVFSTSAIDLFASALGAFILLVMLLFPYYRHAGPGTHLNRLIYTRWESWPNASRPSVPIDYLVVTAQEPLPAAPTR